MLHQHERDELIDADGDARAAVSDVRTRELSPGRWIAGAVGAVLAVVGVLAVTRAGIDASLDRPVVDIAGMGHSAVVGLVELVAGVLLLLSAADETTRPLGGLIGALLVVAGVVGAAAGADLRADLGLTTDAAWFLAVCGVIALAATLMGRTVRSQRTTMVR